MSEPRKILQQECDFCHKDYVVQHELLKIHLPLVKDDGGLGEAVGSICDACREKLGRHIAKALLIEDMKWAGLFIKWRNDNEVQ